MKILLTGAHGQLGQHLAWRRPAGIDWFATARNHPDHPCDLADWSQLDALLEAVQPDIIINAAAWTAVDAAETHVDLAFRLNRDLPARLANWCYHHQARLITFSTDYVFSGSPERPWREDDPVLPESVYGQSKLAGERAVAESGASSIVLRTAWVYSHLPGNFLTAILGRAGKGQALRVVADQVGSPTWAGDLAAAVWALIERRNSWSDGPALLHAAGASPMSWHEFAGLAVTCAVKKGLIDTAVEIAPIASSEWPQQAARPAWSVLDSTRLEKLLGQPMLTADKALEACLEQWQQTQF